MGARFRVLIVGRSRAEWTRDPVQDWTRRLRRHGGVAEEVVRAEPFRGDVDAVRASEGARLLKAVGERDVLIVLDERGEIVDSKELAALLDQARQRGRVALALGGAYGHAPEVRQRAWKVVRLSHLVLNHEVARIVLYEQLYRAMTLLAGVPYHH